MSYSFLTFFSGLQVSRMGPLCAREGGSLSLSLGLSGAHLGWVRSDKRDD